MFQRKAASVLATYCISFYVEFVRTKQFMADSKYGLSAIYYPHEVAKVRLPLGLPAGQEILKHSLFSSDSLRNFKQGLLTTLLAGVAARNELTLDFKKEVQKHLPAMQELNLHAAADYMQAWITDALPLQPLLDVSAHLGWYWC